MQRRQRDALDDNRGRSGAAHPGSHSIEHIGKVLDLRFTGGVFNHRFAFGRNRAHHGIFRSSDTWKIECDIGAVQTVGSGCLDIAVVCFKMNPERLHADHMHVDFAGPQIAAARHSNASFAETSHERTENGNGSSHFGHELIRRFPSINRCRIYSERMAVARYARS